MGNNFEQIPVVSEQELEDRIFLAHNAVQIYYAKLVYRNEHSGEEASEETLASLVPERSNDFRAWYTSKEGKEALDTYAHEHPAASIEAMEDMGDLAQSFLMFMNRPKEKGTE